MPVRDFFCVVLGGDMNSYAVARAFYEAYGIKTVIFGQRPIYPTRYSRLVESYYDPELLDDGALVCALSKLEARYPGKKKILLGNTDYYVRHILRNRAQIQKISDAFIIPMTTLAQFDALFDKESFYRLCELHGLPYPKSVVFDFSKDSAADFSIPFDFPVFLKPSNTVEYNKMHFNGKQKGYKAEDRRRFEEVVRTVFAGGFRGRFLVQEYIPGDDLSMYVVTAYADQTHRVQAMAMGRILMHDRTPELIGNYFAITAACDEALCLRLKDFLEKIEFTGICHFDIQYDPRRADFVVFEMNIRQGRSNLYTLAAGMNLAELLVRDYIDGSLDGFFIADRPFTVSVLPRPALKYCLARKGLRAPSGPFYRFALAPCDWSPMRLYCQMRWDVRVMKAYLKYN